MRSSRVLCVLMMKRKRVTSNLITDLHDGNKNCAVQLFVETT